jgi:MFS family permease
LHTLSAAQSQAGAVLVISGAGSVIGSLSAARTTRISCCYSKAVIACIVVALVLLPILYERWHVMWVYVFAISLGAVSAFAIVAITTHAAEATRGAERGAVFSVLYACASIGYLISACISVVAGSAVLAWILTILVAASLWGISRFVPAVPIIGLCDDIDEDITNRPAAVRVVAEKIPTSSDCKNKNDTGSC